jgi:hypothetical protein
MVELILATNGRSIAVLFGEAVNVFLKKKLSVNLYTLKFY